MVAKKVLDQARVVKIQSSVAVDFDGVIHTYDKGWNDGSIYGQLAEGAEKGLRNLMTGFFVFVHTSRNPYQVKEWMQKKMPDVPVVVVAEEELFWSTKGVIGITNRKLPAIAYIDDRAVPFSSWEELNKRMEAK